MASPPVSSPTYSPELNKANATIANLRQDIQKLKTELKAKSDLLTACMNVAFSQTRRINSLQASLQETLPWDHASPRPSSSSTPHASRTWSEVVVRGKDKSRHTDDSPVRIALSNRFEALLQATEDPAVGPTQDVKPNATVASLQGKTATGGDVASSSSSLLAARTPDHGSPDAPDLPASAPPTTDTSGPAPSGPAASRSPLDAGVKPTSPPTCSGPRAPPRASGGDSSPPVPGSVRTATTGEHRAQPPESRRSAGATTARSRPRLGLLKEAVRRHSAGRSGSFSRRELEVHSPPRPRHPANTPPQSGTEPGQPETARQHVPESSTADSTQQTPTGPQHAPLFPPTTAIIGDSITKGIRFFNTVTLPFPGATIADITDKMPSLLRSLPPSVHRIILHVGVNDTARHHCEKTKQDFKNLLLSVTDCGKTIFISGPLPTVLRHKERRTRLLTLSRWAQTYCCDHKIHFIDNFHTFWNRPELFSHDGIHLNSSGKSLFTAHIRNSVHSSA